VLALAEEMRQLDEDMAELDVHETTSRIAALQLQANSTPYTQHSALCTLDKTNIIQSLDPTPYALHPTPQIQNNTAPSTLQHPTPESKAKGETVSR
jgi:hypothetical protein